MFYIKRKTFGKLNNFINIKIVKVLKNTNFIILYKDDRFSNLAPQWGQEYKLSRDISFLQSRQVIKLEVFLFTVFFDVNLVTSKKNPNIRNMQKARNRNSTNVGIIFK